jgi:ureidoglycolate lyase
MTVQADIVEISVEARPITATAFASFGDVIQAGKSPARLISEGLCRRFTDLARLDAQDCQTGVSLFQAEQRQMPYRLYLMERHPKGSQVFHPALQRLLSCHRRQ